MNETTTFRINRIVVRSILKQYKERLNYQGRNAKGMFHVRALSLFSHLNEEKLSRVLEAAFRESLETEEGKIHHFSFTISPPEEKFADLLAHFGKKHFVGYFDDATTFVQPHQLSALHKIAPAFESSDRKLQVWFDDANRPQIWGYAKGYFRDSGIEIETIAPGQLLIYIFSSSNLLTRYLMSFSNTDLITSDFSLLPLLNTESELKVARDSSNRAPWLRSNHIIRQRHRLLVDLINGVRAQGHGGALLVIPDDKVGSVLGQSIREAIPYESTEKRGYFARTLVRETEAYMDFQTKDGSSSDLPWSFNKDIGFLAQLTAVDGATIITKSYELIAFGAKIKPRKVRKQPIPVWIKEPFEKFVPHEKDISELGGTRHQSAAQFVFDQNQNEVFAIVASQDGKVSIFYWDRLRQMVTQFRHAEYLYFGVRL